MLLLALENVLDVLFAHVLYFILVLLKIKGILFNFLLHHCSKLLNLSLVSLFNGPKLGLPLDCSSLLKLDVSLFLLFKLDPEIDLELLNASDLLLFHLP